MHKRPDIGHSNEMDMAIFHLLMFHGAPTQFTLVLMLKVFCHMKLAVLILVKTIYLMIK
jgi:hypothetical protein